MTKSTAFRAPISMKLRPTQQQYVQTSFTELHTNGIIKVDSRCKAPFAALRKAWLSLRLFSEINQLFWKGIACTKFYPNR
jgi:hypothetical protein